MESSLPGLRFTKPSEMTDDQVLAVLQNVFAERSAALGEHLTVVASLAEAVAARVCLPSDEIEALSQAAYLHDVGKLSLPDTILDKPGPLTEDEWRRIRRHTILGERILLAVGLTGKVVDFVRSSHERVDGGGYPDGLAGEEIPLGARIVAVCDAYDAMTSSRPYRIEARSSAEAIRELRHCAGAQFDSAVVEALTDHLSAFGTDADSVLSARP